MYVSTYTFFLSFDKFNLKVSNSNLIRNFDHNHEHDRVNQPVKNQKIQIFKK